MNTLLVKYINLIIFGGGLLENKQIPYEGLVIEASNAKCCVFLQNPTIVTKRKYFEAKYKYKTPIFTWIIAKFRQNPYINATT